MLDAIFLLVEFIKGLFEMMIYCFDMLKEFLLSTFHISKLLWIMPNKIPIFFSWLPGEALHIFIAMIVLAVVWKIFGRT